MSTAENVTLLFSGSFFLVGLLTGVWKYAHMARSPEAAAPAYVDIAHRASLMYAFACLVLLQFVQLSPWPPGWTLAFALAPQLFFALAIGTYVVHGVLQDTDNQLRVPHRLGSRTLPAWTIRSFMAALIIAEVGGFGALFAGGVWAMMAG